MSGSASTSERKPGLRFQLIVLVSCVLVSEEVSKGVEIGGAERRRWRDGTLAHTKVLRRSLHLLSGWHFAASEVWLRMNCSSSARLMPRTRRLSAPRPRLSRPPEPGSARVRRPGPG